MNKASTGRGSLTSKATAATQDAITKVIEDHRRSQYGGTAKLSVSNLKIHPSYARAQAGIEDDSWQGALGAAAPPILPTAES